MILIPRKRVWTHQPPYGALVVPASQSFLASAGPTDLADFSQIKQRHSSLFAVRGVGKWGPLYDFNAHAAVGLVYPGGVKSYGDFSGDYTYVFSINPRSYSGNIWSWIILSGTTSSYQGMWSFDKSGTSFVIKFNDGSGAVQSRTISGVVLATDVDTTLVVRAGKSLISVFQDGELKDEFAYTQPPSTGPSGISSLYPMGFGSAGAYTGFRGRLYGASTLLGVHHDGKALSENPWQIFRAPYSRIFVPTGVSAPTNVILTATGISTTPTLGTPSVAQDHVLTCAAISTTPTLGTPALTAVAPSGLTAQDISTTPTLGTPAIAQIHTLTATAISATPTLGAPALTVVAPSGLTAQGISTQPVTLDTPTLNQTHGLTAQNITTQAAVLGAPALFGGEHVLPTPLLLSSFSATEDYTYPTNAIVSTYTDGGPDEGKVRMVGDGTAGSTYARRWTTESILPANMGVVAWLVNVRAGSYNGTQAMLIRGSNAGTVTMPGTLASQRIGRRWVAADVSEFGPFAAGDLGTIFHQININQSSPYDSDAVVGPMRYQAKGRPTIVLTFDDVPVEQFDTVFPLMSARGLRGTAYAVKNFTGANPQRMTLANLQSLYAAGWDIGTNTTNDESVTSFASDAACVADLQAAKDWLIANGMTRAVDHMALSNGVWSESRVAALESAGMRTARTTNQSDLFTRFGFGDMAMTLPGHSATGATLATLTNKVDTAILRGSAQTFYFHDVSSTPSGIGTSTSTFTALLDYIKTKVDAGELDVLTVSEWYERDSGVVSLTAADIVTSAPLLGTPALSVIAASALVAQNISTSPPVLGTPALSQNHILSGVAIATGSPTLGTPALTQVAPGMLVAQGITTSPAVLGAPAMAQNHGLSAGAIAAGPPTFTTPTLSQQHALLAQWITAGAAALGQPVLVEGGAPAAIDPGPARYRVRANLRNYRAQVNPRNYRVTK